MLQNHHMFFGRHSFIYIYIHVPLLLPRCICKDNNKRKSYQLSNLHNNWTAAEKHTLGFRTEGIVLNMLRNTFVVVTIVSELLQKHFNRKPLKGNYMSNDKACQGWRGDQHGDGLYTRIIDFTRNRRGRDAAKCSRGTQNGAREKRYVSKCSVIHCAVPRLLPSIQWSRITSRGVILKMHIVSWKESLFIIREETASRHQPHQ